MPDVKGDESEQVVLQNLVDAIVTLKPYMNAFVVRYDPDLEEFRGVVVGGNKRFIRVGAQVAGKTIADVKFKATDIPVYTRCMGTRDLVVHSELDEMERMISRLLKTPRAITKLLVKAIGLKMAFTVPLCYTDHMGALAPYGILGISSKRTDFTEQDLELIRILSVHATQVLSNLQLIRKFESEQALSQLLLDILTHDISNCIQMCYLNYTLMQDGKVPDRETMDDSLSILESNIRILSNVKKLSLKRKGVPLVSMDLRSGLLQAIKAVRAQNPGRKVSVALDVDPDITVLADDLVQDVWLNILQNILKFDPAKECRIRIGWGAVMSGRGAKVLVRISDNGPGIPDPEKEAVFGREQRGSTQVNGTGIGLFVVATIMERYNGRVWIEDRVKGDHTKGSVFCLEFLTPED